MKTVVKILKLVFVIALVGVIGFFGVWNGILNSKNAAGASLEKSQTLNLYPTDLVEYGYTAEFELQKYLAGETLHWQKKDWTATGDEAVYVADDRKLKGEWNAETKTYSDKGNPSNAVYDAITIFLLATYNEATVPFYRFDLDAGGIATIKGLFSGGLMVQGINMVDNTGDYRVMFKEQINAIAGVEVEDKSLEGLIPTVEGILNKAVREAIVDNQHYVHQGDTTSVVYTRKPEDEGTPFPDPFCLDEGTTAANWDRTAGDYKEPSCGYGTYDYAEDATWRTVQTPGIKNDTTPYLRDRNWGDMYPQKYIVDLHYDKVYEWFKKASITTMFVSVDADGKEVASETASANDIGWYLRVSFEADIDPLPEDFNNHSAEEQAYYLNGTGYDGKGKNFNYRAAEINLGGNGFLNSLTNYTGASNVCYTQLRYVAEVWDIGVFKNWQTEEGWYGALVGMSANVKPYSPQAYTYAKEEILDGKVQEYIDAYIDTTKTSYRLSDWYTKYESLGGTPVFEKK